MQVRDALPPEQRRQLRAIALEQRTPPRELLAVACRLERYLHETGELRRHLLIQAQAREGYLQGHPSLRSRSARLDAVVHAEIDYPRSSSALTPSRSTESDPTFEVVAQRERVGVSRGRFRRLGGSWGRIVEAPSALLRTHEVVTSIQRAADSPRSEAAWIGLLAGRINTTTAKLIEAAEFGGELERRASQVGALIRETGTLARPAWARIKTTSRSEHPGQDVYAKHSRRVSAGTCSAEEFAQATRRAESLDLDEADLRRLQRPRELDLLELETVLEHIADEAGITISAIRGPSRAHELTRARRRFVIAIGTRAPASRVGGLIGRSRQYVERVRAES